MNWRQGDLDSCLHMADEFYEIAANRVFENTIAAFETYGVYPVIVNYSFSCELYIKSLMMYRSGNGTFAKGHSLKELIEQNLEQQDQDEIRSRCDACLRTPYDSAMQQFNKAFEDWRYGFEDGNSLVIDIDDLIAFAKVVKDYTHSIIGI